MMTETMTSGSDVVIFGRLLDSGDGALSPDTARYLLTLEFRQEDRERMHALSLKAQEGTLTPEEKVEIDSYERVGHLLSILKSKARRALKGRRRGA
jgi:hypothetical protein